MTSQGYDAIRMGHTVANKIETSNKNIFDYPSSNFRSDFMDMYIVENCKFFICTETGISIFPEFLKKPIVYTNWPSLTALPVFAVNSIFIPKKIFSTQNNRFLNLEDYKKLRLEKNYFDDYFKKSGLKLVNNTENEIYDVVNEIHLRIQNEWIDSKEDIKLQKEFWNKLDIYDYRADSFRIGSNFLKQNIYLLD